MCIRDRGRGEGGDPFANQRGFAEAGGGRDEGQLAVQTLVPVSYTHLRAHETVLDLVCRLLLDKKNHT